MAFMREFVQRWATWWNKGGSKSGDLAPQGGQLPPEIFHHVRATCFADPSDVERFRRCREQGGSEEHCFEVGDNGVGYWGDDTTTDEPICALPPEDMMERWGSLDGKHVSQDHREPAYPKKVYVATDTAIVICSLKEKMPHRANIKNGAGIDLNPPAIRGLGGTPGKNWEARVTWSWLV